MNSTRQEEFTWEQHCEWWREKRSNELNAIWVMEVGGIPVGQVRYGRTVRPFDENDCRACSAALGPSFAHIHLSNGAARYLGPTPVREQCCKFRDGDIEAAEIAISVVPNQQRRGYALALLQETMPLACGWLRVDTLMALVLRTNYPSRRLFRRAGFRYVGAEERLGRCHVRYEWNGNSDA